jgi:hypothetical protein
MLHDKEIPAGTIFGGEQLNVERHIEKPDTSTFVTNSARINPGSSLAAYGPSIAPPRKAP